MVAFSVMVMRMMIRMSIRWMMIMNMSGMRNEDDEMVMIRNPNLG